MRHLHEISFAGCVYEVWKPGYITHFIFEELDIYTCKNVERAIVGIILNNIQ